MTPTLPEEAVTAALAKWMELPSTGDASSLKRDMRAALTAALPFLPVQGASAARSLALEEAARNAAMYLATGFITCPRCGEDVETKNTDAEYALRAALSHPAHADAGKVDGDRWLPIESAPKDGTIVLLGWNDPDINEIGAVAGWYENGPADNCWYDQYHEPVTVTHWMPLRPLPPAPASEGAE
ncbi:hypothetical protein [Brucella sp. 2280]|uniref:hypothetical protein n=1 Tax=Brucella sp. 2280 TaxID=2592625 RepID=UPI001296E6B0|nr:hypothetical protein [Brucella sp. 2280]QGA55905.1 hypothetical protein GHC20_01895 [Brucella sp. 2280]